ncbi:MAG: T9SS type A sorting domain-containing protein [Bacteroidales bacterium]|nr:T9SS type A sorting domain-containing protein [Bacteroidales bacterium]
MKRKLYLLAILLFSTTTVIFAQSERLVLLEHFTQASCGPCALYNPTINTLLNSNPDVITAIMYHTSWPGYDPMYNHNVEDNGARTSYYSVSSVPNSVLDGNYYNGHPNGWNINSVNNRAAIPSPVDIYMHHELSNDESQITVTMMIVASESVAAGMKTTIAVIEKHIHFNTPPGSNGEIDFYNVMKKLLPAASGVILPAMEAGEYIILQYSWEHQNVYDINELSAVGFLQNNLTKEVLQSANSSAVPIAPLYTNDAEIFMIDNVSHNYCIGQVQPDIIIRNNGSEELTSLTITYSINGGESMTYDWTGNLGFLETETITLEASDFSINEMNNFTFTIENPSGVTDEYPNNNTRILEIPQALDAPSPITMILKLDDNPEETTWEFINSQGEVLYEGGPYTQPGQQIVQQFAFNSTDCYTFLIYDAGGDGLLGTGSYAIGYGSTIIAQGSKFGSMDEGQFIVAYTGIDDPVANEKIQLAPNPALNEANILFTLAEAGNVSYSIVNLLGKEVKRLNAGYQAPGEKTFEIDLTGLVSGIYFVNLQVGSVQYVEKLIKSE